MRRLLVGTTFFLSLLSTANAAENYNLDPVAIEPIGNRFSLIRYEKVTVEPGEKEVLWLNLNVCSNGLDSIFAHYVNPVIPGLYTKEIGWAHPLAYNGYTPNTSITITNNDVVDLTFKLKVMVRCN